MKTAVSPRSDAVPASTTKEPFSAAKAFHSSHSTPHRPSSEGRLAEVAALATDHILAMTRSELADVIRSVRGSHLLPGVLERLSIMDGETLRRLVFLTRRYCRNRLLLEEEAASPGTVVSYCR